MADNEIIAAILTTGMLPPLAVPVRDADGNIPEDVQRRMVMAVTHAVGLYRSVFEGVQLRSGPQLNAKDPKRPPQLRDGEYRVVAGELDALSQ